MGNLRSLRRVSASDRKGRVLLRCYAELNDYLPKVCRQRELPVPLSDAATVGSLIVGQKIPVEAVEVALVNGNSCGLDRVLRDGDRVSLYPMFETIDATPLLRLRGQPLRQMRFVADAHLGRLARYLRLLGFDTLFENDPGDPELARISSQEGRVLLSRDRELLQRRSLTHALWIPPIRPHEQLVYLVEHLDLRGLFKPFTRCTVCNGLLSPVSREHSDPDVPPSVRAAFDTFWRCDGCARVYWQGSHYERLKVLVGQLSPADDPNVNCPCGLVHE